MVFLFFPLSFLSLCNSNSLAPFTHQPNRGATQHHHHIHRLYSSIPHPSFHPSPFLLYISPPSPPPSCIPPAKRLHIHARTHDAPRPLLNHLSKQKPQQDKMCMSACRRCRRRPQASSRPRSPRRPAAACRARSGSSGRGGCLRVYVRGGERAWCVERVWGGGEGSFMLLVGVLLSFWSSQWVRRDDCVGEVG